MNTKSHITLLGTGLSGMVGSYIVQQLSAFYTFENLSLEVGIDITDKDQVFSYVSKSKAPWVLHFAAITDVDKAEEEALLKEESLSWKVNVGATSLLVEACKKYQKRMLYISTDFVFPGGDAVFTELDSPHPIGWYATTKYEGEKVVSTLGNQALIVRLSFPYGQDMGNKKDFVGKMRERFEQGLSITAPSDQIFTPTHMDDIAEGIRLLLEHNVSGVYHLVGGSFVSSLDAARLIAQTFGYDTSLIKPTTASDFYKDRAPRATKLMISNQKIRALGLSPLSFQEGITRLKAK
jgi:dTDP-4-dehydrorhamnose reductase